LVDLAKYESLVNDLTALEARVAILKSKYNDTLERNTELEVTFNEAENEKSELHQRISDLEGELETLKQESEDAQFKNLNSEERESLKTKIKDLVTRIDYHLSTNSSR
jgi:chromosome segregation ATPase